MRILVYDERQPERDAIIAALLKASHTVRIAADRKSFSVAIMDRPQIVVLGAMHAVSPETVKTTQTSSAESYVIVAIDSMIELAPFIESGSQDFVGRPVLLEELTARVTAPSRIDEWMPLRADCDECC